MDGEEGVIEIVENSQNIKIQLQKTQMKIRKCIQRHFRKMMLAIIVMGMLLMRK